MKGIDERVVLNLNIQIYNDNTIGNARPADINIERISPPCGAIDRFDPKHSQ
jgi:hypothetical protein